MQVNSSVSPIRKMLGVGSLTALVFRFLVADVYMGDSLARTTDKDASWHVTQINGWNAHL